MTCIVGIRKDGEVWIGGDSAVSTEQKTNVTRNAKVFENGEFLFGMCGSVRMHQLIQYSLSLPATPRTMTDVQLHRWMVTDFVGALRECLKNGGFAKKENEQESGGTFLAAVSGRLFCVYSDYQVAEYDSEYMAIGSGEEYAVGALHASWHLAPKERAFAALEAAAHHNPFVRPPFLLASSKVSASGQSEVTWHRFS